jgi:O-antigen ligase
MANSDIFDSGIVKSRLARFLLLCTWISFLFVAIVGLKPFASRMGIDHLADTTGIDWTRQLAQVGLALSIALVTFFRSADDLRKLPQLIPWPIILVLAWCGLTLFWSPVPFIAFRRLGLTSLVIFAIFAAVQGLGPWPALRLFGFCIAALVFVSVLASPVVPNAVHLPGEQDVKIIGAWRGIFYHKNHSGLIAALCVIISFFLWRMGQGRGWLVAMVPGITLLVMSRSKTSLILCLPALITGLYLGRLKAARRGLRALFTLLTGVMLISIFTLMLFAMSDRIAVLLDDPTAFTGRMTIWKNLWSMIVKSPFGGVGFGSIYHTGIRTTINNPAVAWLSLNTHGHNGYLDIMASTGITGCILALFAFLVNPLLQITRSELIYPQVTAGLLYAILSFLIFHELLETSLLERARPAWVALLVVCAIAQAISRKSTRS